MWWQQTTKYLGSDKLSAKHEDADSTPILEDKLKDLLYLFSFKADN